MTVNDEEKVVVSEAELNELISDILGMIEGKNARMCATALCYSIAVIGIACEMRRHEVIVAAMDSINQTWMNLNDQES